MDATVTWKKEMVSFFFPFSPNAAIKQTVLLFSKGIKEHVCEILEGGEEAFQKRERKYGFKLDSKNEHKR